VWAKSTARAGDVLLLTKPLGTGLVLHGAKRGLVGGDDFGNAVEWMRTLNLAAADALRAFAPSAVTDVTGFGLFGHAHEMASRSGVRIRLDASSLPALPGALDVAAAGERTGGDRRNREYAELRAEGVPAEILTLGYDPQTAGGLLAAVPAERAAVLEAEFRASRLFVARIGRVEAGAGVAIA
jgi:selenide, water dikinase